MAISAADVKALRDRTGMGMMECKGALVEADGDAAAAVEILRANAKGKMDERTDREAVEGSIAVAQADGGIALIELNTETDFTAINDDFVQVAQKVADTLLSSDDGALSVNDEVTALIDSVRLTTKENCSFARGHKLSGDAVGAYVHHDRKKAAIISITGSADVDLLTGLCQHVVANVPSPEYIDEADIPADKLDEVKAAFIKEAEESGKPPEIAERMATGRIQKWIDENTLLGQVYIRMLDTKTKIKDALPAGATVTQFVRFEIGIK